VDLPEMQDLTYPAVDESYKIQSAWNSLQIPAGNQIQPRRFIWMSEKGLRLNPLVHHHVPYWIRSAIGRIYHMFRYTSLLEASCQWPFQEPKLEVPTIYKAYIRPKFQGTSPPQIWSKKWCMKFPLMSLILPEKLGVSSLGMTGISSMTTESETRHLRNFSCLSCLSMTPNSLDVMSVRPGRMKRNETNDFHIYSLRFAQNSQ